MLGEVPLGRSRSFFFVGCTGTLIFLFGLVVVVVFGFVLASARYGVAPFGDKLTRALGWTFKDPQHAASSCMHLPWCRFVLLLCTYYVQANASQYYTAVQVD